MAGGTVSVLTFCLVFSGVLPLIAKHAGWTFLAKIIFPSKKGIETYQVCKAAVRQMWQK